MKQVLDHSRRTDNEFHLELLQLEFGVSSHWVVGYGIEPHLAGFGRKIGCVVIWTVEDWGSGYAITSSDV